MGPRGGFFPGQRRSQIACGGLRKSIFGLYPLDDRLPGLLPSIAGNPVCEVGVGSLGALVDGTGPIHAPGTARYSGQSRWEGLLVDSRYQPGTREVEECTFMPLAVSVWREGELPVKNGGHHRIGGFFLRPAPPWGFFLGLPKGPGKICTTSKYTVLDLSLIHI